MFTMIAIAIAVSAAAMAIANKVNTMPSIEPGYKKRLKIIKFKSAELSINSNDISRAIIFLRVTNPYTPATNIITLGTKYHNIVKSIVINVYGRL